jgi:hypothetical protein
VFPQPGGQTPRLQQLLQGLTVNASWQLAPLPTLSETYHQAPVVDALGAQPPARDRLGDQRPERQGQRLPRLPGQEQ